MQRVAASMSIAIAALTATSVAALAAECAFFQGKNVELVVPFSAGGGFDVYGRMVAKVMGAELGAANMIVRNQPGAGGLLATNQTWTAKPDGLRVQMISVSGMIAAELGGASGVAFKTGEFSWIGRISGEPDVVVAAPSLKIDGMDALRTIARERPIRIGSTGIGSPQYISATLLARLLDLKSEVITGFSGSGEVYASLARGEVDLFASSLSAADAAVQAETGRIVWLLGTAPIAGRADAAPISQAIDPSLRPLLEVHENALAAGRALAAPPKLDPERLQCLRDAFDRAMASETLKADAVQLNRPVEPLPGSQLSQLVQNATASPPAEYLDLLKTSFAQ